nr:2-succinyl-5-enolpyruvyl-6-hydroxy-3-cyclohexene-1-carboxylic-acid synthase [Caldilineaceae bacterium]
LLILTADRPHELRHSGANQTIDQVKIYGDHVLWSVDAALPTDAAPDVVVRNTRTLAARSIATADGLRKGPVHINLPFRKPLEPTEPYRPIFPTNPPRTQIERGIMQPTPAQIDRLAALLLENEQGLIVCGPRCPGADFSAAVAQMARRTGYPICTDPLSGVRFGPHVADVPILGGYEGYLNGDPGWPMPQIVLRFGAVPTSKWLNEFLDRTAPARQIHLRADGVWSDDSHRVTDYLQADEIAVCRALAERIDRGPTAWTETLMATEQAYWQRVRPALAAEFFDAAALVSVVDTLPDGANLVVGNSLPIRHLDQFGQPQAKTVYVFGNRGASGIDGVVSTALGVAAADPSVPTVLLIGDISFYHDLNGLLAVGQHQLTNVTIVLFHNNGGGIFRRLPIQGQEPAFTNLFLTPHGLDFAPVVGMYGLDYVQVTDQTGLDTALTTAFAGERSTVIEVRTDGRQDEIQRRKIVKGIGD